MTTRSLVVSKPSISTSSWLSVCSRSELLSEPRSPPTASISSMKMIAGRCLRAIANRRRMREAPRPANISTNAAADCEKKFAPASCATALASSVLPVPGGPCSRMPRGTFAPSFLKRSGSRMNSTTSCSSAFASSQPATSSQPIAPLAAGLISTGLVLRHHLERPPDEEDQQAHEDDGGPRLQPLRDAVPRVPRGTLWNWCGLCEQCEEQLGPPCRSVQQVYRSLRAFTMRCGP